MFELPLIVEDVYMYEKENAVKHHTYQYEMIHTTPPTGIFRRGQSFNCRIKFNRPYINETDIVRLLFSFGPHPNVLRGTRSIRTIQNRESYWTDLEAWGVRLINVNETYISIELRSPIDSPVGLWQLQVKTTTSADKNISNSYAYNLEIYVLFNPWLKGMNMIHKLMYSEATKKKNIISILRGFGLYGRRTIT